MNAPTPPADDKRPVQAIIPARYDSTRFPGKPLADILGRPMFWHVWNRASQCRGVTGVALATDDERIARAAADLGVPCVMTRNDHPSGTDRVYEAACLLNLPPEAIVVNIQGDEPALVPASVEQLLGAFADPAVRVATLARHISPEKALSFDVVKVVCDAKNNALYFSRALVPHDRDAATPAAEILGHMGVYAFTLEALGQFVTFPPSRLEKIEKLEQLRLLENGVPLRVVLTEHASPGVDRPEDLALVVPLLAGAAL
jgi:3-deoxy-D-manno-octulosonate cytidylyltransferase